MKPVEEIVQLLRQNSLKVTPQRRVIIELLHQSEDHPTAEVIFQRAHQIMPDVSRTTVYNTFRELVGLGEIIPVSEPGDTGTRYDTISTPHHHLYCVQCHQILDIAHNFPEFDLAAIESLGFQIKRVQVTFLGICPDCHKSKISLDQTEDIPAPQPG